MTLKQSHEIKSQAGYSYYIAHHSHDFSAPNIFSLGLNQYLAYTIQQGLPIHTWLFKLTEIK